MAYGSTLPIARSRTGTLFATTEATPNYTTVNADGSLINPFFSNLRNYTASGKYQLSQNNQLSAFWTYNRKYQPHRGAGVNQPRPEGTLRQESPKNLINANWTSVMGQNTFLEVSSTYFHMHWPSKFSDEFYALPDAQNYTTSDPVLPKFTAQTNWIVAQKDLRNIVYVAMEGDITNDNVDASWQRANTAMSILESPSPGIPYAIAIGNHDQIGSTTTLYNSYFGSARFNGRSYYGGHYGSDNNNNYVLFSASGMDFIAPTTPPASAYAAPGRGSPPAACVRRRWRS